MREPGRTLVSLSIFLVLAIASAFVLYQKYDERARQRVDLTHTESLAHIESAVQRFGAADHAAIIRLTRAAAAQSREFNPAVLERLEEMGYWDSLWPKAADQLHARPDFQRLVALLRKFRTDLADGENTPARMRLDFAYLMVAVPDEPEHWIKSILVDADYDGVAGGAGREADDTTTPIGTYVDTREDPAVVEAFAGVTGADREWFVDGWGDRYMSARTPVKNERGQLIAVLALDFDVRSEAKLLQEWRLQLAMIFVLALLLAGGLALLVYWKTAHVPEAYRQAD